MIASQHVRRSLTLSVEEWRALEAIARQTNSTATAGPATGGDSWRALIRRIAQGELRVIAPSPTSESGQNTQNVPATDKTNATNQPGQGDLDG